VYFGILLMLILAFAFVWFPTRSTTSRCSGGERAEQNSIGRPQPWHYKIIRLPAPELSFAGAGTHGGALLDGREGHLSPVDLTAGWRLMSIRTCWISCRSIAATGFLLEAEIHYHGLRRTERSPRTSPTAHLPANDEIDSRLKSIVPAT